ncbi:slc44a2 [Symbiodinium sp. CCMP2592]|nr:slc44a2 [Symbiodinium sp. CCMP2592]
MKAGQYQPGQQQPGLRKLRKLTAQTYTRWLEDERVGFAFCTLYEEGVRPDNILEAARTREQVDHLLHPEDVPRHCTDVAWLVTYAILLSALVAVCLWYAKSSPLLRLSDYEGTVCGIGKTVDTPMAYVCSVNLNGLQTAFTVCRESCPESNRSKYRCREKPSRYDNETAVDAEVADYATETIPFQLSNLCVPMEMKLMNHLFAYHAKEAAEVRIYVVLKRMIVPLLVAATAGICISHGYLWVLKDYALAMSTVGIRLIVLVPIAWAAILYFQNGEAALLACVALLGVGAFLACLACAHMNELTKAAAIIQLSCECVLSSPLLQLGPLGVLATRLCTTGLMVCCLFISPAGLYYNHQHHHFRFDCGQDSCPANLTFFIWWLGMFLWTDSTITASWEFGVAYLASAFYTTGGACEAKPGTRENCEHLSHFFWVLFRYHFGTMIKAAMIIGFLRPFRFLLGTLTAAARIDHNLLGSFISVCCGCVVDVYERHFEKFSANAYIEVALSSEPLWSAAKKASEISHLQVKTAGSLNGTTFIFQLICGAMVWWAGYFIVYLTVGGYVPGLEGYGDPFSGHYIGNPHLWSNAGGILAVLVAFPYMMVFDAASDTILYCAMSDKVRQTDGNDESSWTGWSDVVGRFSKGVAQALSLSSSDDESSGTSSSSLWR